MSPSRPTGPDAPPAADVKLLPGTTTTDGGAASANTPVVVQAVAAAIPPPRQLSELPRDELEHLAEEYGLDPTRYKSRQEIVAALHDRRQLIASFDREAMIDVVRWGRRPVTANATKDQVAQEIARCKSMRFAGLSQRGLVVLARMRGVDVRDEDDVPALVKKLKKKEGFFAKFNRKRRSWLAGWVAGLIGGEGSGGQYQFLPSDGAGGAAAGPASLQQEIEDSGLIGGITSRLKKTADSYVNQKLDEIEARIDRKLDEIDRRLGEWRDKEIANRIRILKITLWASVIVAAFSLVYSYVVVYFFPNTRPTAPVPQRPVAQQTK